MSERIDTTLMRGCRYLLVVLVTVGMLAGHYASGQSAASQSATSFPPLELWRTEVLAGDLAALQATYSTDPPAQVQANGVKTSVDADINFWLGLKAQTIELQTVAVLDRPKGTSVVFKAAVKLPDGKTLNVTDGQMWRKQGEQWHVISVERADAPRLNQPSDMNKNIYPADADAHVEIKEAEEKAASEHKRVLLVFGANWCYDCHVLDLAFQRPDLTPIVESGYEVVHIDLGPDEQKNADVVKQFDVPLNKGIPVLAVIESDGKLLMSQKNGEFEDARSLAPQALLEFLNKWKARP
jgi:thioredoxin-related protein